MRNRLMRDAGASHTTRAGILGRPLHLLTAILAGAPLWGLAASATILAKLWMTGRLDTGHVHALLAVYAVGGAIAWVLSILALSFLTRFLVLSAPYRAVLAACGLGLATIAVTAFLFALDYRAFYVRWHADAFTRDWILQFLFTGASAVYQFLVLGLRLYLPLGPLLVLLATPILLRLTR
jgi:hypothetical protein